MGTRKLYMKPLADTFDIDDDELLNASWHTQAKEDVFFSKSSSFAESAPAIFSDQMSNSTEESCFQ